MKRNKVPVKTSEGSQEIASRALGLAPRIRTALLLVDGVKSVPELERLMAAAGVTPGALQLLLEKGLIRIPDDLQEEAPIEEVNADAPIADKSAIDISETPQTKAVESSAADAPESEVSEVITDLAPNISVISPIPNSQLAPKNAVQDAIAPAAAEGAQNGMEVVTLLELETILGGATQGEMDTIVEVATLLELTPTLMLAPDTAVKVPLTEPARLPPLAQAEFNYRSTAMPRAKVVPASVLRSNLIAARAHLANALDLHLEIDGYAVKQKMMACESRDELEQMFRLIEGVLLQRVDKLAATRLIGTARSLLDR